MEGVEKYWNPILETIPREKLERLQLKKVSGGIQAVDRNVDRILASIRMLEINISETAAII